MSPGARRLGIVAALLALAAAGTGLGIALPKLRAWLYGDAPAIELSRDDAGCRPIGVPCSATHARLQLALGLGQSVSPLQAFPVTVSVQGAEAAGLRSVELAFTMQGMDMGILRTPLLRQADGSWRGRGLLPVCAAGRSDWLATVTATGADGERYRAQFAFPAGH